MWSGKQGLVRRKSCPLNHTAQALEQPFHPAEFRRAEFCDGALPALEA